MRFVAASLALAGLSVAAAPARAAPASAPRRIVLPAMPLGPALLALAGRTRRNILFRASDVKGRVAPSVDAAGFDDALEQMLRHSDLVAIRLPGGAIRLTPRPMPRRRPVAPPPRAATPRLADRPARSPDIIVNGKRIELQEAPDDASRAADTLTAADIRRLPDRTIAEALGRLPGVLTLATSLEGTMGRIDHAGRAVGDFLAVRGLPGSYLETRIDGVELPQSLPYSRGAQLGMMAGEPGTSLRLNRILGPSQSGEAIAGQLEVDHASPFAASVQGVTATLSVGLDDRSRRLGQGAIGVGTRIAIGTRTPDRTIAVYVSAGVSRTPFTNVEQTYQAGNLAFAITDAAGGNPPGVDAAANVRLASINAQVTHGISSDIDAHIGIGWRPDPRLTILAQFSGAWRSVDQNIYQISAQGGRSPAYFEQVPIGPGLYRAQSVRSEAHYWFQTNPERDRLGIAQLSAAWSDGALFLQARLFGAIGRTDRPDHIEMSFWSPSATRLSGGVVPVYRDGLPVLDPGLGDTAILATPLLYPIHNQGERASEFSRDHRLGGEVEGRIDRGEGGTFSFGATILRSDRERSTRHDTFLDSFAPGTPLGQTGLVRGSIGPLLPGIYDYVVPVMSGAALGRLFDTLTPAIQSVDDRHAGASSIREERIAVYASLAVPVATRTTMTLGVRAQSVGLIGHFWLSGNDGVPQGGVPYGWNAFHAVYRAILPSLSLRWKAAPHLTLDGAAWTSQTRPSPYQLTGGGSAVQDSQGAIVIDMPSPGLKPVDALNLDLGLDWRSASGFHLALSGFAKRLRHYLYDAGDSLNNGAGDANGATIRFSRSRNGGTASIAGIEASGAMSLAGVAPALRHVTLGETLTLLDSAIRLDNPALSAVERSQYAPALSTRSWIRYDDGRLSVDLSYRTASAYIQEYGLQLPLHGGSVSASGSALDTWVHPSGQLDLGGGILVGRSTLRLSVRNMLDSTAYRSSIGRYSQAVPQTIIGGRQLGISWTSSF